MAGLALVRGLCNARMLPLLLLLLVCALPHVRVRRPRPALGGELIPAGGAALWSGVGPCAWKLCVARSYVLHVDMWGVTI